MLIKILCFFAFLALSQAAGHERIECYQGTVVYNEAKTMVYFSDNVTLKLCQEEEHCGSFLWTNVDDMNRTSYIEVGFCHYGELNDCSGLMGQPGVGDVTDCQPISCDTNKCNVFSTEVCDVGNVIYDTSGTVVILIEDAQTKACNVSETCGMFRFINYDSSDNYNAYVESGICFDSAFPPNCTDLIQNPAVGEVSTCSFADCNSSNGCPKFSTTIPQGRGFVCDVGTFVYDFNDRSRLVFADNVTNTPCKQWEACGMYQLVNTDESGQKYFIESGFCIDPYYIQNATCESLLREPGVGMVNNCSVDFCSGDRCLEFSHLKSPPGCPERADIDDVQALPGCTVKQVLRKSFSCFEEVAGSLTSMAMQDNCSMMVDNTIACMSDVVQECIQFENDNMTLCPSVLDAVSGIDFILKEVKRYAMQVQSVEGLRMVLETLLNGTGALNETLDGLDLICSNEGINMGLEALRALAETDLNLGTPVCADNMILDDLIKWALEEVNSFISANETADICLAFDKFKARMEDAVVHRCYGLDRIGVLLQSQIGSYYADIVQRSIDIAKYFLLKLSLPGCEGFKYPVHLVCNQGTVAYLFEDPSIVVLDESNATVCPPYHKCGMYRWDNTDQEQQRNYVEFGICESPYYNYSCADVRNDPRVIRADNCSFESCHDGSRCSTFTRDVCPDVPDDDVAILPRCTLSTSLERGFGCLGSFVGNYPYDEQDQCRSEVDDAAKCLLYTMQSCLSSNCETVLDFIPGLRAIYKLVLMETRGVETLAGALRLLGMNEEDIENIYRGICDSQSVASIIDAFLNANISGLVLDNPICDDMILQDLVQWGMEAAREIIGADEHQDVCMAFMTIRNRLVNAWETRCDADGLNSFLASLVPPQLRDIIPVAVHAVLEFFEELEIPNCDQTGGMFDCSRFYEGTSACSMRRAWLCDYVNWKVEFLTSWFDEFNAYIARNMIAYPTELIACVDVNPTGLCIDESMRRCPTGKDGCRFCFCADHRYKDLTKVMGIYKRDWMRWRRAFDGYKRVMQSNQETCMMD